MTLRGRHSPQQCPRECAHISRSVVVHGAAPACARHALICEPMSGMCTAKFPVSPLVQISGVPRSKATGGVATLVYGDRVLLTHGWGTKKKPATPASGAEAQSAPVAAMHGRGAGLASDVDGDTVFRIGSISKVFTDLWPPGHATSGPRPAPPRKLAGFRAEGAGYTALARRTRRCASSQAAASSGGGRRAPALHAHQPTRAGVRARLAARRQRHAARCHAA